MNKHNEVHMMIVEIDDNKINKLKNEIQKYENKLNNIIGSDYTFDNPNIDEGYSDIDDQITDISLKLTTLKRELNDLIWLKSVDNTKC